MYPQKLAKKTQIAGGSFRQEFFLRDLTANLLFSSSDVSCSPGELDAKGQEVQSIFGVALSVPLLQVGFYISKNVIPWK